LETFISEQEIEDFEDAQGGGGQGPGKPYFEFKETSVHKFEDKYFLICGENLVFALNEGNNYSNQLTTQEMEALDFTIVWNGPKQKVQFESNDEKAVESILQIINNVNLMQTEDYYGFPLASIISHLRAFLYQEILEVHTSFYTTITVSGDQKGTG
jgi:hypothetical protein